MATEGKVVRGHPVPVRSSSFIDYSTGYATVNAVLAGLLARERTGEGQLASTSLLGNAIAMQSLSVIRVERALSAAQVWVDGERKELVERGASYAEQQAEYAKVSTAQIYECYYRAYRTKDGAFALGTLAVPPRIRLLRFLGLSDPRIEVPGYDESTPEAVALAEELVERMEAEFAKRTTC